MKARDQAVVLQAASVCLRYPDEALLALMPVVRAAVDALHPGTPRERLGYFLDTVAATAPERAAQHYVEVFDTRRRCCLYLTWWTDGETRRRGAALAGLKARYRRSGVEFEDSELPDFLPAVLEFAATADLADGLALLQENRPGIELLRLALLDAGTPYAAPVEAVCALLPGASPADVAAAKALARSGPPREQVGLDLPTFTGAPFGALSSGGPA
ncbi:MULTISPECIES: nitrate reductase molybdenum cofactor assembly chaperone [unclassified Pseudonocardia]|uniref:nitrate reductase molybdenum cofactor assembly chaperone n=1 Tax=unclassified Pseudonocardia TaxID=2619320 RepID=UPI00095D7652|nr:MULTISPECIES: nitrate reductase molybdenum cofactor assembly chaperone [unclassified Pseudonocardia]OJY44675.1 MAG: nitrate reductase molybdenum cofactor assembly chaperone [Pseudonocardia sp. 73-21]